MNGRQRRVSVLAGPCAVGAGLRYGMADSGETLCVALAPVGRSRCVVHDSRRVPEAERRGINLHGWNRWARGMPVGASDRSRPLLELCEA